MGQTIVVGVDGSVASSGALRWAAVHAAQMGAELRVLNVWDIPAGWGRVDLVTPDIVQDLEALAKETVDKAVEAASSLGEPDLDVKGEVLQGWPPRCLTEASRSADLLVVGNVGHSQVAGMLLGSVADFVVRHAACPVAVIPLDR